MRDFTATLIFCLLFLFQESAFANGTQCLENVKLVYVNVGFVDGVGADGGNGIYIGHLNKGSKDIVASRVNTKMNLNDGSKGFALYQALMSALALELRVSTWDHDVSLGGAGSCDDFDEVRLIY